MNTIPYIHPQIVLTADGSESLYLPEIDEHYHSHHGALQESVHVYLKSGLQYVLNKGCLRPKIFELGIGTFLNTFLTLAFAERHQIPVSYHGIEKYPIHPDALKKMNYLTFPELIEFKNLCHDAIDCEWDADIAISEFFRFKKTNADFLAFEVPKSAFDLLYFDAFGYRAQSEMWSREVFVKCFDLLKPNGVLVTYASKGVVRRTMEEIGFVVDRIEGAPGKREMMRATKP